MLHAICGLEIYLAPNLEYFGLVPDAVFAGVGVYQDIVGPDAHVVIEIPVQPQCQIGFFPAGDVLVVQVDGAVAQREFPCTAPAFWLDAVEAAARPLVRPGFARQYPAAVDIPAVEVESGIIHSFDPVLKVLTLHRKRPLGIGGFQAIQQGIVHVVDCAAGIDQGFVCLLYTSDAADEVSPV